MGPSVVGAREFLNSPEGDVPDDYVTKMIEDHLPENWRRLIYQYGHARVFDCIRCGLTIGGARYYLIRGFKPLPIESLFGRRA